MNYCFRTRLGWVQVSESARGVSAVKFNKAGGGNKLSKNTAKIKDFLAGRKIDLSKIPLDLAGASSFQRRVWRLAGKIPYGEVRTYGWMAERLESSPRAVGQALKKNPVPIIIPCHRVVSSSGIGGYSCGVRFKKKLLDMEGALK